MRLRALHSLLLCAALSMSTLTFAKLTASVDRTKMALGETLTLTVSSDDSSLFKQPDFSPVDHDFNRLSGISQSSNMSVINNKISASATWSITLMPKSTGTLVIPPITLKDQSTQPVVIQVSDAPSTVDSLSNGNPFVVMAEVHTDNPFVQQQVLLTIRAYFGNIRVEGVDIGGIEVPNTVIESLGKPAQYKTNKNGINYNVVEYHYALFPQQSGILTIPPIIVQAAVADPNARRSLLGGLMSKTVQRQTEAVDVSVKERPVNLKGQYWLPAQSLSLVQSWSTDPAKATVGEAITRTITLTAEGLIDSVLPQLPQTDSQGLKIYEDKAQTENQLSADGIVSKRVESQAVIPTRAGTLTLPALTVHWWDVKSNKARTATLPEQTIIAVAGVATINQSPISAPIVATTEQSSQSDGAQLPPPPLPEIAKEQGESFWQWLALGLLALWVCTIAIVVVLLRRLSHSSLTTEPLPQTTTELIYSASTYKAAQQQFRKALKQQDLLAIKEALLAWASQYQQQPVYGLDQVATSIKSDTLTKQLNALQSNLYGQANGDWSPAEVSTIVEQLKRPLVKTCAEKENLPPLYL